MCNPILCAPCRGRCVVCNSRFSPHPPAFDRCLSCTKNRVAQIERDEIMDRAAEKNRKLRMG